jgi:hypothetical protein
VCLTDPQTHKVLNSAAPPTVPRQTVPTVKEPGAAFKKLKAKPKPRAKPKSKASFKRPTVQIGSRLLAEPKSGTLSTSWDDILEVGVPKAAWPQSEQRGAKASVRYNCSTFLSFCCADCWLSRSGIEMARAGRGGKYSPVPSGPDLHTASYPKKSFGIPHILPVGQDLDWSPGGIHTGNGGYIRGPRRLTERTIVLLRR